MVEVTPLEDGSVQVKVMQDGFLSIGTVSSHHLVEPKVQQLKADIAFQASAAFDVYDDPLR